MGGESVGGCIGVRQGEKKKDSLFVCSLCLTTVVGAVADKRRGGLDSP